ncbi:hypothetical protein SteCoe_30493 [Stentor coeruleus]|uniref:Dynein regulatory complex subunit 2 n=1 Tax=Stentor coeruleus TaxID=5963 RepID=A0A1R2B3J4_9CILI|nr:hypothetical protein SteCoe_30493 [Stentor coeruleus]
MVLLGKLLKGRSTRAPKDLRDIRVRRIKVQIQQEDLKNEEEFRKRKREHLRNSIQEEQKITNFNNKKLLTEWRKIMRMAKTDELKREIEIFSQNHEREVDSKDAVMQMLDRDLEEAEEQYQTALRNYMIHVDRLLYLQETRLQGLEEEFKRDLRILEEEFTLERQEIVETHRYEKKELQDVIHAVQEEEKARQDKLKSDHESNLESSKRNEETSILQRTLESKTNDLKRELELNFTNYQQGSKDLHNQFYTLMQKNQEASKDIEKLHRQVEAYKNTIEKLKTEAAKTEKECAARNQTLKNELDTVTRHYHELKNKMIQFREEEVRRLTLLINNSRDTTSKLRDQVNLGSKILKLAELCRKLETEREKVIPFYASDPEALNEEKELLENDRIEAPMQNLAQLQEILQFLNPEYAYDEFAALENFYKRFNKVLLDKLAIEKQKKQLEKENLFFKSLLKQYLDGVSVNEDVMSGPNPLLVVNNRIQLNRPPVERVDKPIIEAAHVIQNRIR